MRMVHTVPKFLELHRPCSGGHVHKFWAQGFKNSFDRDLDFLWNLCQTIAQLLQDQLLDMEAKPVKQQQTLRQPELQQGGKAIRGCCL